MTLAAKSASPDAQPSFFAEPEKPVPALTPMMQQYWDLKNAHPECLLFFRMGDFYELFYDDAVTAAPVLDVALTRRGKEQGEDIAMCGVPVHAYEAYIPKLIRAGFRVAIAEQMEDPAAAKKRAGAKALVERQIIRIITPGTLTEESFLDSGRANYLAVLVELGGEMGLAWCDLTQGAPEVQQVNTAQLAALVSRLAPGEIVVPEKLKDNPRLADFLLMHKEAVTFLPQARFDSESARRAALRQYCVTSLDAFGAFSRAETTALGVLIDYIHLTQKQEIAFLQPPRRARDGGTLAMDAATRRNLELTIAQEGGRKGSLLATIDRTLTHAGARLLAEQLAAPLTELAEITRRQLRVDVFYREDAWRGELRGILKASPDLPRALTRLALRRGSPRDLAIVRASLETAAALRFFLNRNASGFGPDIKALAEKLGEHSALVERLSRALKADLPMLARDGGFIAPGYSAPLDELVALRDDSRRLIAALQAKYAQESKISSLKIRHNNVMGYHVEVTPAQADRMLQPPLSHLFIHRQTLASAVRFTTAELAELERKVSEAADKALQLEMQLFEELVEAVLARSPVLRAAAEAMAELDVASALAEIAREQNWCRPEMDEGNAFFIKGGRHPVVEASLRLSSAAPFIANDCDLGENSRLWLLTGPNMAGKSTFLRQNAILVVLAQMGSFVPATSAQIGIVDRLFSRVGAADDLARGRSTFMVEMIETASILHQATQKSLVILDEIGRGTATFDGLSIAWGALEYLYHHNKCRGLFATHYHELTALKDHLPHLCCATAKVKEWQGEIIFLHEIARGVADRSYGIHVAQLAGLPAPVLTRAREILARLEEGRGAGITVEAVRAESFTASPPVAAKASPVEAVLEGIRPDELTPREALEKLYALKNLLRQK